MHPKLNPEGHVSHLLASVNIEMTEGIVVPWQNCAEDVNADRNLSL